MKCKHIKGGIFMKEFRKVLVEEELGSAAAEPVATVEKDPSVLKVSFGNSDVYSSDVHSQGEEVEGLLIEDANMFLTEGLSILENVDSLSDEDFLEFLQESTLEDLDILEALYETFLETEVLNEGLFSGKQKKLLKRSRYEDVKSLRKAASGERKKLKGSVGTAKKEYLKTGRAAREKELKAQSTAGIQAARQMKRADGESIKDFSARKAAALRAAGQTGSTAKKTAKTEAKTNFKTYKDKVKSRVAESKKKEKEEAAQTKEGYKKELRKDWEDTSVAGNIYKAGRAVGKGVGKVAGQVGKVAGDVKKKIETAVETGRKERYKKEADRQSKITLDKEKEANAEREANQAKAAAEKAKKDDFENTKKDLGINASFQLLSDEEKDILFESLTIQELSFLSESLNGAEMPSLEGLEYKEKFEVLLKHFGAEKISDLSDEDKKEFFNTLDAVHTSKDEMKSADASVQVSDKSAVVTLPKETDSVGVAPEAEEALKEAFRVVRRVLSGSSLNEEESVEVPMDAEAEVKVEEDKIVIEIPVESPKEEISEEEAEELQEALDVINFILN
jgi:hypothetical protein